MGRLIDADALLKEWRLECCGECCWGHDRRCIHFDLKNDACTLITEAPTVELKPIVIDGEEYLTGSDYNAYLKGYKDGRSELIVHCKDCMWYIDGDFFGEKEKMCAKGMKWILPDDYCSAGVRKNEVEDGI